MIRAEKTFRLRGDVKVGGVIKFEGRHFTIIAIYDRKSKLGRDYELIQVCAKCLVCGNVFTFKGTKQDFWPTQRCGDCR